MKKDRASKAATLAVKKRTALLEAGVRCISRLGLPNCTMEDFAVEAGISRVTLYREFKNRDEFIEAVHALRFRQFNEQFAATIKNACAFSALLETYFLETARASRENEFTRQFTREPIAFMAPGSLIHNCALEFWTPIFTRERQAGRLPESLDFSDGAQWILLMQATVSRLSAESAPSLARIQHLVRSFVTPAFQSTTRLPPFEASARGDTVHLNAD